MIDQISTAGWLALGAFLVLIAGTVWWNARLTYYRLWCWVHYKATGKVWIRMRDRR